MSSVRSEVEAVAAAGLSHIVFLERVEQVLRRSIGYDVGALATTDPATVLPTYCVLPGVGEDARREALLFRSEYLEDDFNRFADLALAPTPAATLRAATGSDIARSWRYGAFLAAFGIDDELRLACVSGGHCWGTVELYRASSVFSEEERVAAASLSESLADGIRLSLLRTAVDRAGVDEPGMVVVRGRR